MKYLGGAKSLEQVHAPPQRDHFDGAMARSLFTPQIPPWIGSVQHDVGAAVPPLVEVSLMIADG